MSGFPYYVHINDNNGKWDWDLMAGTCNLWLYMEFLYYLKELGYDGWITSDTSPVRQDPLETFAFNVRITDRIWKWLDEVDREAGPPSPGAPRVHADPENVRAVSVRRRSGAERTGGALRVSRRVD